MSSLNGRVRRSATKSNSASLLLDEKKPLTPRELEVAKWIGRAKGNAQIAQVLKCSVPTVKKHVQNMLEKLGLENRLEICVWCHNEGKDLIESDAEDAD
jgi:DNA-binding CsgD family transcriptional regulator